jgi:hypothetical protein
MGHSPQGLEQRLVFSLLRAAARVGLRFELSLKDVRSLLDMAYFREARVEQGMKLQDIGDLFDRSLRSVASLHKTYQDGFFRPERELSLRRAIAALADHAPTDRSRLSAAFPDASTVQLDAALDSLIQEEVLFVQGQDFVRNQDAHLFVSEHDHAMKVDGLNRQMDIVAEAVWRRFVRGDRNAQARTWVFGALPEGFAGLVDELVSALRSGTIEADRAAEGCPEVGRYAITFAATPLEEQ